MTILRTVADLDETGPYAWPGGDPVGFYPVDDYGSTDGTVICFDCARRDLEDDSEYSDGQNGGFLAEIEGGDQRFYGGISCDQCSEWIVEPCCPECGDELSTKTRVLYANTVDANTLCLDCAARLLASCVNGTRAARRVPGVGVEILPTLDPPRYGWDAGTPWYAPAGTIYAYRMR